MIPFRKKQTGPVLSQDEGARQGQAVRSARAALPSTEAVRAFLNSHHAGLSGRPIDLAVASQAGLVAVEKAIAAQALHLQSQRRAVPSASGTCAALNSADMAGLGIARVPAGHFETGGYRYTNLGDSVAEARARRSAGDVA